MMEAVRTSDETALRYIPESFMRAATRTWNLFTHFIHLLNDSLSVISVANSSRTSNLDRGPIRLSRKTTSSSTGEIQ
jgi:hypothetical protein